MVHIIVSNAVVDMITFGDWFQKNPRGPHNTTPDPASTPDTIYTTAMALAAGSSASSVPVHEAEAYFAHQRQHLENAMAWADVLMEDEMSGATQALDAGAEFESTFHRLGAAATLFMRGVTGFDPSNMNAAAERLAECEVAITEEARRAQRMNAVIASARARGDRPAGPAKSYPPGTEYELARAEAQLMGAVMGILHGQAPEGTQMFHKMRRAWKTLEKIVDGTRKGTRDNSASPPADSIAASSRFPGVGTASSSSLSPMTHDGQHLEADDPMVTFIDSGMMTGFGVLNLVLSLIPPPFSQGLSVVGLHTDRSQGLQMLWNAAGYPNIHGAIASSVLLSYYNGNLGRVDVLPDMDGLDSADLAADVVGPPRAKLDRLIASLRARYPNSKLWVREESRQRAFRQDLTGAIDVLQKSGESLSRETAALNALETALNAMFMQDWELMRAASLRCLDINEWSPATYSYMVACAELELYRDARRRTGDGADEAQRHKAQAAEFFRSSPMLVGKRPRKNPLEDFIRRRLATWEERGALVGLDLVDVIGPSPAMEMCYLWSGHKRMNRAQLETGLQVLGWQRCTAGDALLAQLRADANELAIWAVSMAPLLTRLGRYEQARELLKDNVLCHDR